MRHRAGASVHAATTEIHHSDHKGGKTMHTYDVTYEDEATGKTAVKRYENISEETLREYISLYQGISGFKFVSAAVV